MRKVVLNKYLIQKQGLNDEEVAEIMRLHDIRLSLMDCAEKLKPTDAEFDKSLMTLYEQYIENQFELQDAWGFVNNADWHDWFLFPHCKCPKQDNFERRGTRFGIYNSLCPIHYSR